MTEDIPQELLEFLEDVAKDPVAKQALADAIASGALPKDKNGNVSFTVEGLNWMERRENELRLQQN